MFGFGVPDNFESSLNSANAIYVVDKIVCKRRPSAAMELGSILKFLRRG